MMGVVGATLCRNGIIELALDPNDVAFSRRGSPRHDTCIELVQWSLVARRCKRCATVGDDLRRCGDTRSGHPG